MKSSNSSIQSIKNPLLENSSLLQDLLDKFEKEKRAIKKTFSKLYTEKADIVLVRQAVCKLIHQSFSYTKDEIPIDCISSLDMIQDVLRATKRHITNKLNSISSLQERLIAEKSICELTYNVIQIEHYYDAFTLSHLNNLLFRHFVVPNELHRYWLFITNVLKEASVSYYAKYRKVVCENAKQLYALQKQKIEEGEFDIVLKLALEYYGTTCQGVKISI